MHTREEIASLVAAFVRRFGRRPTVAERAPGRVDLMGSHTDYNEGMVMTMAIDRDTVVLAAPAEDRAADLYSLNLDEQARFALRAPEAEGWASYVAATVRAAADEGLQTGGFSMMIHSNVPIGSGLSSSAALECAVLRALMSLSGRSIPLEKRPRLCQRAENLYVGVNCGILDQYSSTMAEENSVVVLDCRHQSHTVVRVSKDVAFVIGDTNAPRNLGASEYGERRRRCEEGAAILAESLPGVGTLRDVALDDFERLAHSLPEVTAKRCRFIIEESARVDALARAFEKNETATVSRLFGESFAGARDLFEITVPAMEAMVGAMECAPGCIGARQAGAGFGGCMIAAVESRRVDEFMPAVAEAYQSETGISPDVYAVRPAGGASSVDLSPGT